MGCRRDARVYNAGVRCVRKNGSGVYGEECRCVEVESSEEALEEVVEQAVAGSDSQIQRTQGPECAMI